MPGNEAAACVTKGLLTIICTSKGRTAILVNQSCVSSTERAWGVVVVSTGDQALGSCCYGSARAVVIRQPKGQTCVHDQAR